MTTMQKVTIKQHFDLNTVFVDGTPVAKFHFCRDRRTVKGRIVVKCSGEVTNLDGTAVCSLNHFGFYKDAAAFVRELVVREMKEVVQLATKVKAEDDAEYIQRKAHAQEIGRQDAQQEVIDWAKANETAPARIFVPSLQQQAVFNWIRTGRGNAFVEAVAGAGKTTTLLEAMKLMPHPPGKKWWSVAYAAYNTKIADEVKAKIAKLKELGVDLSYVRCGTFHSFGLSAWRKIHSNVRVADGFEKQNAMLEAITVRDERSGNAIKTPEALHSLVSKLVSLAKNDAVLLSWSVQDRSRWFAIIDHHDLADEIEDPSQLDLAVDFAIEGIKWSKQVSHKLIDFDDMIWLPAVTDCRVWQNDWLLVDEAQDTNATRRALARKMAHPTYNRMIWVGDRHQAIYGFTGADNDSIDRIVSEFGCKQLPLTTTYRCPKSVVKLAQQFVSHIHADHSAPEGRVRHCSAAEFMGPHHTPAEVSSLTAADAILCRKTAPLVSLAFKLLRAGIACHVEGRDIGQGLVKLAKRWKIKNIDRLVAQLEKYRDREVTKLTAKGKETAAEQVNDRVDCLLALAEGCPDVDCVVAKVNRMFKDDKDEEVKTLTLSTVHKAKGREWNRVYILGYNEYMPSRWARQKWQQEQETNLIYVAITRSQLELITVDALDGKPRG